MSKRADAKRNLELAGLFDADSDYDGAIGPAVMKLVEAHCDEGHSGASHSLTMALFNRVIEGKALTAKYWDEKAAELRKISGENYSGMTAELELEWIVECIGARP